MEVDEHELNTEEQNMVDDEEKTLPPKVRIQQLIDKYTQSTKEQAHLLRKINEVAAELKMFKIADSSANNRIDRPDSDVIENDVDDPKMDADGGVV